MATVRIRSKVPAFLGQKVPTNARLAFRKVSIKLASGDTIHGRLVGFSKKQVVLTGRSGMQIQIPRTAAWALQGESLFVLLGQPKGRIPVEKGIEAVVLVGWRKVSGRLVASTPSGLVLESAGVAVTVPWNEMKYAWFLFPAKNRLHGTAEPLRKLMGHMVRVRLANGNVFSGSLLRSGSSTISIKTRQGMTVTIPKRKVLHIVATESVRPIEELAKHLGQRVHLDTVFGEVSGRLIAIDRTSATLTTKTGTNRSVGNDAIRGIRAESLPPTQTVASRKSIARSPGGRPLSQPRTIDGLSTTMSSSRKPSRSKKRIGKKDLSSPDQAPEPVTLPTTPLVSPKPANKAHKWGLSLTGGYGYAYGGFGVGLGIHLVRYVELAIGLGYFPPFSLMGIETDGQFGWGITVRFSSGGNHRFIGDLSYGLSGSVAYEDSYGSRETGYLTGMTFAIGYEYLSEGGFIFDATIGFTVNATGPDWAYEILPSRVMPTLSVGCGYKFN